MTDRYEEKALEIIEKLIEYDAWRDDLHPNDFPTTKLFIAQALKEFYEKGFEDGACDAK